MKRIFVLTTALLSAAAQRPSYAGSGYIGFPDLANRFKDDTSTTTNLGNRFGEKNGTTERIPIDALGDRDLVNRLNQWPNQTKPFWLLNAEHIENHRNTPKQPIGNNQPSVQNVQNQPNTNLENKFGSTDNNSEIDDFGNPIKSKLPSSVQPTRDRFAGSLP